MEATNYLTEMIMMALAHLIAGGKVEGGVGPANNAIPSGERSRSRRR